MLQMKTRSGLEVLMVLAEYFYVVHCTSICVHASCAVACAHSLKVTVLTVGCCLKSHYRRRRCNLGRHLQWSCCRCCHRCSPSHHLLPVSMSILKVSNLFVLLVSLEETVSQALEAP